MGCKLCINKIYLKRGEKLKGLGMLKLRVILAFIFTCKYIVERNHLVFE